MTTFVVAHGAWSAAWAWKKMRPLLRGAGHALCTPTYTGLGERAHLASREVGLETHIADVLGTLEIEDLRDVVSSVTATAGWWRPAWRTVPAPVARLVYLDAFVPRDGQSLLDLLPAEVRERMREAARTGGEWLAGAAQPDAARHRPRRIWPGSCRPPGDAAARAFEQPMRLAAGTPSPPRSYIYCTRIGPSDVFRQFAERARAKAAAPFRDRRQPQPAHHCAGGAAGATGTRRGNVGWAKAPAVAVM